jgi:hypothetical protein
MCIDIEPIYFTVRLRNEKLHTSNTTRRNCKLSCHCFVSQTYKRIPKMLWNVFRFLPICTVESTDKNDWLTGRPNSMQLSRSWEAAKCATELKIFPVFYETRRFIIVITITLQWSISWYRSIQFITSNPTTLRYISILFKHLHLGVDSGLFTSGFPTIILNTLFFSPNCATRPAHFILLTWSF